MGRFRGVGGSLFFLINKQTVPGVAQPGHRNVSWVAAGGNNQLAPLFRQAGRVFVYLTGSQELDNKTPPI